MDFEFRGLAKSFSSVHVLASNQDGSVIPGHFLSVFILGLNIHWTSNYGTGIVFIGNMLSWLSFHNFV